MLQMSRRPGGMSASRVRPLVRVRVINTLIKMQSTWGMRLGYEGDISASLSTKFYTTCAQDDSAEIWGRVGGTMLKRENEREALERNTWKLVSPSFGSEHMSHIPRLRSLQDQVRLPSANGYGQDDTPTSTNPVRITFKRIQSKKIPIEGASHRIRRCSRFQNQNNPGDNGESDCKCSHA
jgi:hypothetical protein